MMDLVLILQLTWSNSLLECGRFTPCITVQVDREQEIGRDPALRQRIADAHIGLRIMRFNSMRMLSGV